MKKKRLDRNPLDWIDSAVEVPNGVQLSSITYVHPEKLKNHSLNSIFFKEESTDYFERLKNDVRERGIIVPLIAKGDGTLLSGHNRLRVAIELELATVPVQYVLNDLDVAAEKEFLIKDNLIRRQFSQAEWIQIYRNLYPNFDQEILQEKRGGGKKWSKTEQSGLLKTERLTAKKIATDTGQKVDAVEKQLTKFKKSIQENPVSNNSISLKETAATKVTAVNVKTVIKELETVLKKADRSIIEKAFKDLDGLKSRLLKN